MRKKKLILKRTLYDGLTFYNKREKVSTEGNNGDVYVAKDIKYQEEKRSNFSSVDNYDELVLLTQQDKHLYEVATTSNDTNIENRVLYADFDCFKKNPTTINNLIKIRNEYILKINNAVNTFKQNKNVKISEDDVIVLLNNDYMENGVKSFHFIVYRYSMKHTQQEYMIEEFNDKKKLNFIIDTDNGNKIEYKYDEDVYTPNQQFRMINQTKKITDDRYTLVPLDKKTKTINTFITNTTNCILLYYHEKCKSIKDKSNKDKQKHKITKQEFKNFVDKITHKKLFDHTLRWKNITKIILKFELMEIDEWNDMSIRLATREFNREENIEEINIIKEQLRDYPNEYDDTLYLLTNTLNMCSDTHYFIMVYDVLAPYKEKLKRFIENHSKLDINVDEMKEHKPRPLLTNDNYEIELRKGFITDKRTKSLYYFFDTEYIPRDIYKKVYINKINDVDIDGFINSDDKILALKSFCKTGKSHHILEPIIKKCEEQHSILIIPPNTSLNLQNFASLKNIGFMSHLEAQKDASIKLHEYKLVICSIQSIWKLKNKNFDYIFLDEFEYIQRNFAGDNFNTLPPNECYEIFRNKCERAQKIICLDADLNDETIRLFTNHINYDTRDMKVYHNKENPYADYKFIITLDHIDTLLCDIETELTNNKKIVIASNSCTAVDTIFSNLQKYNKKKTCCINGSGVYIWNGKETIKYEEKEKLDYIQNLENNLIKDEIDVWVYSPTITAGISINKNIFDYGFAYATNYSTTILDFLQQQFRARNLNDKEIKIYLDKLCLSGYSTYTYEVVKNHIVNKTEKWVKAYVDLYKQLKYPNDKYYTEIFSHAKTLTTNSRKSFAYLLVNKFYEHNLNLVFERKTNKPYTELGTYKEHKEDLEDDREEEFNKIPLLMYNDFMSMKEKIDKKDNSITKEDKNQFYKTKRIYNIYDIRYNEIQYDDCVISSHIDLLNDDVYTLCNKKYNKFYNCKKAFNELKEHRKINTDGKRGKKK